MTSSTRSSGTSLQIRPITTQSSASKEISSENSGRTTGSFGPTTEVLGLRNSSGWAGTSLPSSWACSTKLRPTPTTLLRGDAQCGVSTDGGVDGSVDRFGHLHDAGVPAELGQGGADLREPVLAVV